MREIFITKKKWPKSETIITPLGLSIIIIGILLIDIIALSKLNFYYKDRLTFNGMTTRECAQAYYQTLQNYNNLAGKLNFSYLNHPNYDGENNIKCSPEKQGMSGGN